MPVNCNTGPALPVTIIGGYLGSGKTTLINHVLNNADGRRYAVLVNDFGELAIDAQLIESTEGNVISLSGGCVCCSYGSDLTSALLQLDTAWIDQVVIEASGVALPGAIAGSVSLLETLFVSSIIVLADSAAIDAQVVNKYISDTIERQLGAADIIIANKTDLIDAHALKNLKSRLQGAYPSARVLTTNQSNSSITLLLLDIECNSISRSLPGEPATLHDASMYTTFTLDVNAPVDVQHLASLLADANSGLLRVKGFARSLDGSMVVIQIVGARWSIHPAPETTVSALLSADVVCPGLVCIGLANECSEENVRSKLRFCSEQD